MTTNNISKRISVRIVKQNGKDVVEPACPAANAFAALADRKFLSQEHCNLIQSLGYHIHIIQEQKSLHSVFFKK